MSLRVYSNENKLKKQIKIILKYNWGFSLQLKKFTFEVSYFRL